MFKDCFGSTHIAEHLQFSIFPLILSFHFNLIWGSFLSSLGTNGLFLGVGLGVNFLGSANKPEQLLFHILCSILVFHFYPSFWLSFTFGAKIGYFGGLEQC